MDKIKELDKIKKEIENCRECKRGKIGVAVPGEGNPNAKIMFIGEAPGKLEAKQGRPFIGRSGKFLRKTINEIGLNENDVFITSSVKYLPKYKTPKPADIIHGKSHLNKQINIINPKIMVLLGSTATFAILGEKIEILKNHGRIIEKDKRKFLITLHPAAVIRFPKYKPLFIEDMGKLKGISN